jgi:uncharacterized protein with NRDE domain
MCLLLLSFRAHPDVELLLGGNRDEFHRRPSAPPSIIHRNPTIFAGQDLEAGGTWMGRNEFGLVAALTNRRDPGFVPPPNVRSRGEIVLGLLRQRDSAQAAAWLADQPGAAYRPFSVLFGDRERFYYHAPRDRSPGGLAAPRELAPGCYALSNSSLDDRSWPKVERSLRFLEGQRGASGERMLDALQRFLCDATPPDTLPSGDPAEEIHGAMGAVFIRAPGYGTVSATIVTEGGALGARYYYAEAADMLRMRELGPPPFRRLETAPARERLR